MNRTLLSSLIGASFLSTVAGTAMAGGLERGGYNIDLLFDPSRFAAEATATYVMPDRKLDNVVDVNPANGIGSNGIGGGATDGVRDTEDYWVPRIGVKFGAVDAVDCMFDYSQPWGAHSNPGADWMGANSNIETKINSDNYAATCSYKMQAGKGQFRVIGGVFYQEVDGFKVRSVAPDIAVPGNGQGRLELAGNGVGWRIGAAYEIPEIALRASLVYNSEVNLGDITGTLDLSQVNPLLASPVPVVGQQAMPASVELKLQTGIAPGWLAFGSVKWVDWSQLQVVPFACVNPTPGLCAQGQEITSLELLYRDGWTVQGGVGHSFNEQWSGAVSLTWDRGTSTTVGTQSDTWTLSAGAAYTPNQNVEVRFGGALGVLTSGSSADDQVTYSYGNDLVSALSGTLKVKF
ncbi:OmpP1/FadL family transporter [Mesorhizobium sp. LHD-90]|uniref:OmpP1/FadL family transporter n=1 Tax=Mesorhizobium sp. LHD-90 TaxID=3071414 RepID=UPI0027E1A41B|nr:OmpP1/FadL family transporter [Mesorhizobium sp. LHD-90]MDQ6437917.1 OmpP1/FadL family transporter [Mesorhizobium sp. LHD-90]